MMHFLENPETWVAIGFVVFVALVFNMARRAIGGGLDKRADTIRRQLDEAAALRAEADAMLKTAQQKQREALKEAAAIVEGARAEAERLKARSARELEALIQRRQQTALDKIAQAESSALAEVRNVAVDTAIAAATRLLSERMTGQAGDALIDGAIADLPNRLN